MRVQLSLLGCSALISFHSLLFPLVINHVFVRFKDSTAIRSKFDKYVSAAFASVRGDNNRVVITE